MLNCIKVRLMQIGLRDGWRETTYRRVSVRVQVQMFSVPANTPALTITHPAGQSQQRVRLELVIGA